MRSTPDGWSAVGLALLAASACADAPAPATSGAPVRVEAPVDSAAIGAVERSGLYVYWADAARFTDCASGQSLPVAMEGASIDLEHAHLRLRSTVGEGTWMRLTGRVEARPSMEPGRDEPHLVVDALLEATPDIACPGAVLDRSIEETRWVVSWLPTVASTPSGWLRLDGETRGFQGHTGCRSLSGTFEHAGTRLRFGGLTAAGSTCGGISGTEDAVLLEALRLAGSYRVRADTLELMGEAGVVARLTAR